MSQVERLAAALGDHLSKPPPAILSGPERVLLVVYPPTLERAVRARIGLFRDATQSAEFAWSELDLTSGFAQWLAGGEEADFLDALFARPADVSLGLEEEFPDYVAGRIKNALDAPADDPEATVVAVSGVGALYGFCNLSEVLARVDRHIRGRLVLFFPGSHGPDGYRLLEGAANWNYKATPITLSSPGAD